MLSSSYAAGLVVAPGLIDTHVRTLADVERLDSAFEQEKDRRKTPSGQNRTPSAQQPSKFRNFEERSYNMDELTKELLRSFLVTA